MGKSLKKYFEDNENRISIIIFIFTICVAISPLISRYCINGHDLEYHLLRIEALKEGIITGHPFSKVNSLFFGGAGYASSMFYSDTLLYIPALLRVAGISIASSYHIFVALIFILGYLASFYCTYKMSASKYAATAAALMFTLCSYHMDDMLVRGACGEYMAFIFVPFVVYGVYDIIYEDMKNPLSFAIGFAGLILTHPATLFFCIIFVFIVFVINIKVFIKKPTIIVKLAITTIITVIVTSFQWLPMIEQMLSTSFYVSSDSIDMLDAAVPFAEIFSVGFPTVGILLLICAIPRAFISKKEFSILKYTDELLITAAIFALLSTDIMPWERLERYLRFIQFPWRMYIMVSVLLSMADAVILILFAWKCLNQRVELILFMVLAAFSALAIIHQSQNSQGYYDYGYDYYSYKPFTANVIGGEWLPAAVVDRDKLIFDSEHMYADDGSELIFTRERGAVFSQVDGAAYVDVPFIYYKGYAAVITDSNGQRYSLTVTGEAGNGMTRVYTNGLTGMLTVYYAGTRLQMVSVIMSGITLLILIILPFVRKRFAGIKKSSCL